MGKDDFGHPTVGGKIASSIMAGLPTDNEAHFSHMVVTYDGVEIHYDNGDSDNIAAVTDDARYILGLLPEIIATFLEKNKKYASVEDGYDLGEAGIIPDVNRKLGILVDRIWHGRPTVGEDTDEVIGDVIGHLLLMLAKRRDHG